MVFLSVHSTSLGIGLAIALSIFILVRKNHLMISYAIWWLMIAVASVAFGAYPRLIDRIGMLLGIHYPPILLIVVGIGLILIKMLTLDLKRSEQERKIRALTQRLAILEAEMFSFAPSYRDSVTDASVDTVNDSETEDSATNLNVEP